MQQGLVRSIETSCKLVDISMCDMGGNENVPWKIQVEIVTRRMEQLDREIYGSC